MLLEGGKNENADLGTFEYSEIDFQDIIYYAAPIRDEDRPKEIDLS